jgi:hypothetical protein
VADDAERALDNVDLLGRLVLPFPQAEVAATLRALLVRNIEPVDDLDERQGDLLPRAVAGLWGGAFRLVRAGPLSLLARGAEQLSGPGGELLVQECQLELQSLDGTLTAGLGQFLGEGREARVEAGELGVLEECDLAEALNVPLRLDLNHA